MNDLELHQNVRLVCIATTCMHNLTRITGKDEDLNCNMKHVAVDTNGNCASYVNANPSISSDDNS